MSGEFIINPMDNFKRAMYHVKESLKDKNELTIISGVEGAFVASIVCENLVRLNYVTYSNISTSTKVVEGKRRINLVVVLKKTKEFQKLYDENEAKRKLIIEEKEKNKTEFTKENK